MKKTIFLIVTLISSVFCIAQKQEEGLFKGTFYNDENDITIAINLYDTTIVSPNYSFLGKLNGYMTGRLYDAWFITTFKITGEKALVNFSNDIGSDSQQILFYFDDKGQLIYEAQGTNVIRRAEDHKWYKLPTKMIFIDKKKIKPKSNYFDQIRNSTSPKKQIQ